MTELLAATTLERILSPYREQLGGYNFWLKTDEASLPPTEERMVIPVSQLFDRDFVLALLGQWDETLGSSNLKVAASLWTKYYCVFVMTPVLAAMTLGGVGLSAKLEDCRVVLAGKAGNLKMDGIGHPVRVLFGDQTRPVVYAPRCVDTGLLNEGFTPVESVAELQRYVFKGLFEEHFTPLFDRFQVMTGLSKKIMWGTLAAGIHGFYRHLGNSTQLAAVHVEDGPALLETIENELIAPGKNPLYQPVVLRPSGNPAHPEPVEVRTTCCLWYKIPEVTKCHSCPLIVTDDRISRARAAHASTN